MRQALLPGSEPLSSPAWARAVALAAKAGHGRQYFRPFSLQLQCCAEPCRCFCPSRSYIDMRHRWGMPQTSRSSTRCDTDTGTRTRELSPLASNASTEALLANGENSTFYLAASRAPCYIRPVVPERGPKPCTANGPGA